MNYKIKKEVCTWLPGWSCVFPPLPTAHWRCSLTTLNGRLIFCEHCNEHRLQDSFFLACRLFCVLLLLSHRNNQGRFYCGVKKKKRSCLLTLPSAGNNKKKMASFACVSWMEFFFLYLFNYLIIYLFILQKPFPLAVSQKGWKTLWDVISSWPRPSPCSSADLGPAGPLSKCRSTC